MLPLLLKYAIEEIEYGGTLEHVLPVVLAIVALAVLRSGMQIVGRTRLLRTARRVEADIREDALKRLSRLGPDFYAKNLAGDLTSRVINDLEPLRMMAGFGLAICVGMSFMFVMSLGVMVAMDAKLAAIAAAPLLGISAVFMLTARKQRERSDQVQATLGEISAAAQENFAGVRVVRACGLEEAEVARMSELSDRFLGHNMGLARVRGASWALLGLLTQVCIGLTLWIGGRGIMEGTFTNGELAAFLYYEFMLIWPMIAMGWVVTLLQRAAACAGRLRHILDAPAIDPGSAPAEPAPARIEIRNLNFTHEGREEPVLRGVSLSIAPGKRLALVGRTGAGKSTLVRLLAGLHPVPPGRIFFDGADVTTLPVAAVRGRTAFVPQEDFLFSESLRENIAFGSVEEAPEEAVLEAARTAELDQDVAGFPDGYGTVIGEKGITLSGGQRQRTCLARALVKDAATVVLDDAFSSVDVQTERRILKNLEGVLRGRTVLWVTHRLFSLRGVDAIAVLEGGRIVEVGDFETLVAAGGAFARLLQQQTIRQELEQE